MKQYYPAVFLKEYDGQYSISFPDVPEALTCGVDFENAMKMAKECLGLCLEGRKEDGDDIPSPNFKEINLKDDEFIIEIEFEKTMI